MTGRTQHLDPDDITRRAAELHIWGFPYVFAQRLRWRFTLPLTPDAPRPETSAGAALNRLGHQRRLSDPTLTSGVAPNVDTLYSLAFLDLAGTTFRLRLPDFGDRYYSIQIGEADSSTAAVLGQRTHGAQTPEIIIRHRSLAVTAAESATTIACRSRFVMVAIRILVDPSRTHDLRTVHELQDRIELEGPGTPPAAPPRLLVERERHAETHDTAAFLESLSAVLADTDTPEVPRWVTDALADTKTALDDPVLRRSADLGLAEGLRAIQQHVAELGRTVNGWSINDRGTDFGDDHLLRAAVAYSQIYINPAEEAIYPVCERDHNGRPLTGTHRYSIRFAPGNHPPADYFWSLTVYHAKGLLYDNEINRYAITDRTPGLHLADDGSLTIQLQNQRPTDPKDNWLPCPSHDFRLMLRLYGPNNPTWNPPPAQQHPSPDGHH
ncbi:DUF1214 domain-containing protein [Nocardia zapadnayensis]|uniref:DUF1214 domain-containing protein n=1 Tax=Nocardia rhamnosiphila TaxID=426716 RepID=UPI0022461DB1|nr:DUF1214 domain-containing protein [Nocardia zapadnayensis]MCX0269168.1 DUF1214 domain-containing protein [Nocardia zapadnayensis]